MANVVVTSDMETVFVVFNDAAATAGMDKASYRRADIQVVYQPYMGSHIVVHMVGGRSWEVSHVSYSGAMTIDSVDGVEPVSMADLFDMLRALQL